MRLASPDYESLLAAGISPAIARFATAKEHPIRDFSVFVRRLEHSWDYYIPPDASDVVGLWECNADAVVRWRRAGVQEFVELHHDDPEHTLIAWTEQGLLAELARQFYEVLDWRDEVEDRREFRAFAEYIGFRYAATLEKYMVEGSDDDDFQSEFGRLA